MEIAKNMNIKFPLITLFKVSFDHQNSFKEMAFNINIPFYFKNFGKIRIKYLIILVRQIINQYYLKYLI